MNDNEALAKSKRNAAYEYSEKQKQILIANKIIPESADDFQIAYFFEVCARKKLDPFQKHIHMVERKTWNDDKNKWDVSYTIQASIDGMRVIAQRNVKVISYRRWCEKRENDDLYGICEIQTADRGAYKDELPFNEYCQKTKQGVPNKFWKQFPQTMIKKCAEESVLRMMSPEDLSNIFGDDEMMQADKNAEPKVKDEQNAEPLDDILNPKNEVKQGVDIPQEATNNPTQKAEPNSNQNGNAPESITETPGQLQNEDLRKRIIDVLNETCDCNPLKVADETERLSTYTDRDTKEVVKGKRHVSELSGVWLKATWGKVKKEYADVWAMIQERQQKEIPF